MAQKISKIKADEMIADLKERLELDDYTEHFGDVNIIIYDWLDEHVGIADININLDYSEAGTILDTSEGVV